jgi:predicted Rossmann fold flavoprotein
MSYPLTGSTGDGYRFAQELGHQVRKPQPSLVPLEVEQDFVKQMQGLSLKNVELSAFAEGKRFARLFGEMLFTHFGVSGPIVLTISQAVVKRLGRSRVSLSLNLKPALKREQLEQRLVREFEKYGRMKYRNVLKHLLPSKAVDVFVGLSEIHPDLRACEIDREGRRRLLELLTNLKFEVKKARPIAEAIVTDGGVDLSEIDPYTMQSRLIKGLFFSGEVIDIAGDTGGYNLQAAFSTGFFAGESASKIFALRAG